MSLKKIFIFTIIFSVLAVASYTLMTFGYSTGVRSGRLVKLSKKGFLVRTYEGTLDLGSGDKLTWDFSIHDSKLGDKLLTYSGNRVRLSFKELLFSTIYNTKYNVTQFEIVDDNGGKNSLLCRLVSIIKKYPSIVDTLREDLKKSDGHLLEMVRRCTLPR